MPFIADFTRLSLPDAELLWCPDFIPERERAALFQVLRSQVPWEQHRVRIVGREMPSPRLSCWIGDPGTAYRYSGILYPPRPWPEALARVRDVTIRACGEDFNSVLANLYRDGRDSMGYHSDDEASLGPGPVIASLSLGAPRRFVLQHRASRGERFELVLGDGSLLLMRGATQRCWRHALPESDCAVGERINLTFRRIILVERSSARPRG